ncbi:SPOR domain-containing protein [Labilibaculum sp.]|uniref:SPOR domain-containing protein n=1 Tax=Labilibaculum sp. TaxID=2060723 RepID=UPI00356B56EE
MTGTIGSLSPFFDITFASSNAGSSTYGVEIAKFKYPVFTDYFESIDDVLELTGEDGTYHYVSGLSSSKSKAEDLAEAIKSSGYAEAKVLNLNETFSSEQIAEALRREEKEKDENKKEEIIKQELQKKSAAEIAIGELTDIGNDYFYTILLEEGKASLNAEHFSPYHFVKVLRDNEYFHYVMGRFDDVADAVNYLKTDVQTHFPMARVAVINKGNLIEYIKAEEKKQEVKHLAYEAGSYNMGRKMRGKEYVDYYYDFTLEMPIDGGAYVVELGTYSNKTQADEAVRKLKELGFSQAKIKSPSTAPKKQASVGLTPEAHFTIQVYATKLEMSTERLDLPALKRTFDQKDALYRYFYGDFDNYWVCRRELREIRNKGFFDAFIVKL